MGTVTAPPESDVEGVIQSLGLRATVIRSRVADTAYGATQRRLYPLVLLLVAVVSTGLSRPDPVDVVTVTALLLLAVWVGGHRP